MRFRLTLALVLASLVVVGHAQAAQVSKLAEATELFPILQNGKLGYINKSGKVIIPPTFDASQGPAGTLELIEFQLVTGGLRFHDGLAPVIVQGKWGYINTAGKIVIAPKSLSARHATVLPSGFSGGLAIVKVDGKYGYLDQAGKIVIPPQFPQAQSFSEGFAPICVGQCNSQHGYVDRKGHLLGRPEYWVANPFSEGLANVGRVGGGDYIDRTGKVVIKGLGGMLAGSFSEGLARVTVGRKWGWINPHGKMVIPAKFAQPPSMMPQDGKFCEGLASFYSGMKSGYLDKSGHIVIPARFDGGGCFSGGLALVAVGQKFAYINITGKIVYGPMQPAAPAK